jgi:hypothetical protein
MPSKKQHSASNTNLFNLPSLPQPAATAPPEKVI